MKDTIRIGYLSTVYHTSILMKGSKLLEQSGLQPTWTLFGTGPAIMDALVKNKVDVAYIGLSPVIIGISKGAEIKCVAGGHVEGTVVVARPGYKSMSDSSVEMGTALGQFRGKRLGVPRRGSLHDVFLRHYLSEHGLEGDVDILNYDWTDFVAEAMAQGEIEGGAGTPSLAVLSSRLMGASIVVPPNEIWPNNPSYGIIASTRFLDQSSDLVEKFLLLHRKACASIREEPESSAKVVAETVGIVDSKFVLDAIRVSPKYCTALSREFVESTMRLLPLLERLGYLSTSPKEKDIFYPEIIERVHPEQSHYQPR